MPHHFRYGLKGDDEIAFAIKMAELWGTFFVHGGFPADGATKFPTFASVIGGVTLAIAGDAGGFASSVDGVKGAVCDSFLTAFIYEKLAAGPQNGSADTPCTCSCWPVKMCSCC
jgi:hypothetical protein